MKTLNLGMILALAVGVFGCATSGPRILGHRGTRGEYQENCAEAMSLALGRGITGFETDIRMTQDGRLVIIHDADVARVSDGKGVAVPQVRLSFPVAHADGAAPRAYDYEVEAVSGGKVIGSKLVFSPGCYWADETDTGAVECAFAKGELPPDWRDTVAFTVTPRDSFGNRGPALGR